MAKQYGLDSSGNIIIFGQDQLERFTPDMFLKCHPIDFIMNHVDPEYQQQCIAVYLERREFIIRDKYRSFLMNPNGRMEVTLPLD